MGLLSLLRNKIFAGVGIQTTDFEIGSDIRSQCFESPSLSDRPNIKQDKAVQ